MQAPEYVNKFNFMKNAEKAVSDAKFSMIQDKITGGEQLPSDIVKEIYTQFLPYDTTRIEKWVNDSLKAYEKGDTIPSGEEDTGEFGFADEDIDDLSSVYGGDVPDIKKLKAIDDNHVLLQERKAKTRWRLLEKEIGKNRLKENIKEIIRETKQSYLRNGILRDSHFYSSKNKSLDFEPTLLREFDKKRIDQIVKGEKVDKQYLKEEIKYEFTYSHEDLKEAEKARKKPRSIRVKNEKK